MPQANSAPSNYDPINKNLTPVKGVNAFNTIRPGPRVGPCFGSGAYSQK